MTDDQLYVLHISECIARVERFTHGGEDEFFRDEKTQDAVVRNLQVMAESSKRLSAEIKESHPEVNWRKLAGFRNIVVHNYLGLNMRTIWEIVTGDLPELKRHIKAMLGS